MTGETQELSNGLLLNIGCGNTHHPSWVNIDLVSSTPEVKACDVRSGLYFSDDYFDAVYHSHVLEHLTHEEARNLISECFRILKPGGILRVVVPDFEVLCRQYLQKLKQAEDGEKYADVEYEWAVLCLIDQMVRTQPGGGILRYAQEADIGGSPFLAGNMSSALLEYRHRLDAPAAPHAEPAPKSILERIKGRSLGYLLKAAYFRSTGWLPKISWRGIRQRIAAETVRLLCGGEMAEALGQARFRMSGELHKWGYDRYSLRGLLTDAGFMASRVVSESESAIPNYAEYGLDMENGMPRKPSSIYVEAEKPASSFFVPD